MDKQQNINTIEQRAHEIYGVLMDQARVEEKMAWLRAKQEANKFWLVYIDNNPNKDTFTKTIADNATWIEHQLPHIQRDLDEIADAKFELRDSLENWLDEAYEDLAQLGVELSNTNDGVEICNLVEQIKVLRYNIGLATAFKAILAGQPVIDKEDN